MADITASTALDNRQFSQGLRDALAEARSFKTRLTDTLNFDPLKTVQQSVDRLQASLGKARTVRFNVDTSDADKAMQATATAADRTEKEMTDVEAAVVKYRNATLALRNEIETSVIGQREGIQTARRLRDESLAAAQGTERWSKDYRDLLVAAGRADRSLATLEGRTTKLGMSQQVAIGSTNVLSDSFQRLQGAVTGALAAFGLARGARALTNFSAEAAEARNAASLFYDQLARGGQSVDQADGMVARLSERFQTTSDAVQRNITVMLRAGAELDQIEDILIGAGASALNFGRNADEGFENAADAFVSGRSTLLNAIGISKDLSVANLELARSLGKSSDALTNQEKALAFQNLILGETQSEVASLDQIMGSFVGAQQRARTEVTLFRRATGEGSQSFLTPLLNIGTAVLRVFNSLPTAVKTLATGTAVLGVSVTALAVAYGAVRAALAQAAILQGAVAALVAREAVARTALGASLLRLAGRYKLLTAEQTRNTVVMRRGAGSVTLMGTAMQALRSGLNAAVVGVRNLTRASLRFIATPVGAVLALIVGAFALITKAVKENQAVMAPAFRVMREATKSLSAVFQPLVEWFQKLFEEGGRLSNMWRTILARTAQGLALTIALLAQETESLANAFSFLSDIGSKGVRQAWADFQARAQATREDYLALREEINTATRAAIDGTTATTALGNATEETGDEAEEAAVKLAELRAEAQALAGTLQERFRSISISLIEDDEAREIAEVREEFRGLRDEIIAAAQDNTEFRPLAPGFLSEAFAAEQERITRIQAEHAQTRKEAQEEQAAELASTIIDRERAIVDARMSGQTNELAQLQVTTQRRLQDTRTLYDDLIQQATAYGQDTTNLERLRTEELTAIQEGYATEVLGVWNEVSAELGERQRQIARTSLEQGGNERGLLSFDYAAELSSLDDFYASARERASGNAQLLASIDSSELDARRALRETYWTDVIALAEERGEELADKELEVRRAEAETAGDTAQVARLENEERLREIRAHYDAWEERAQGNAAELRRITQLRNREITLANQQLAETLQDQADEAAATQSAAQAARLEAQTALQDAMLQREEGLAERRAELAGDETSARQTAYARDLRETNAYYDDLRTGAERSASELAEIERLRNEEIRVLNQELREDLTGIRDEQATEAFKPTLDALTEGLDDASLATLDTIREQLEAWRGAYGANGEIAALIDAALGTVASRVEAVQAEAQQRLETLLSSGQKALEAYADGIQEAKEEASQAASDLLQSSVEETITSLVSVQATALQDARTSLTREIGRLAATGVNDAVLDPLRAQVTQMDDLLAQQARSLADFADDAYTHLREVANAVLSENDARRVAVGTFQETIRLRRAALAEAHREAAGLEEVQSATRGVTTAQLTYIASLQGQVTSLEAVQGAYGGVFAAARDVAGILGRAIPPAVVEAQRDLALAGLDTVQALQAQGATFAEYRDQLQDATGDWQAYQDARSAAIEAGVAGLEGQSFSAERDLARQMAEAYEVSFQEALRRINGVRDGSLANLFDGLDARQPDALQDIFAGLNDEAARTPDTIAQIDAQITTLEEEIEGLKTTIAESVNFDAAGQQLVSGYEAVLEQITVSTGDIFEDAADEAIIAFTSRFASEQARLQDELETQLGAAAEAAGDTAGAGLMNAFARGIRQNEGNLIAAVEAALTRIRERLPSSDAKRGPLSDLTHSGRMFTRTWLSGATSQAGRLTKSMDGMFSRLTPNAALRAATASPAGPAGPVMVNVDGRSQGAPGGLAVNARQLVNSVQRELVLRGMTKGR